MRAIYSAKVEGGTQSVVIGEVQEPIPEDDQVLIKVSAAGVNVQDLRRLYVLCPGDGTSFQNPYTSPYLGFECSGHVIATGSNVTTCKKGDRVCAYTRGGGSFAEVVAVPEIFVVVVPSGIPLMDAAALPQATCLVLWCFTVLRNIKPGMKILIHGGGGGGFGCIAIQYAKYVGCEVYATEGNDEKVQLCQDLGAEWCINYRKEDFCQRVKLETNGKGVEIILDHVGKEYLDKNFDCLATGGSLIVIGKLSSSGIDLNLRILDRKRISFLGASLETVPDQVIGDLLTKAVDSVWPLISRRVIKPIIGKVVYFSKARAALRAMEDHAIPGKLLLTPERI